MAARRLVTPLARALDLLSAFTAQDGWLSSRELAERTDLPASTVTRIARTLADLGYLHFAPDTCRYRLAAAVLALGYAAIANSGVQRQSRQKMREFALQHRMHLSLGSRDRLDIIVVESFSGAQSPLALDLQVGSRVGICSSPMGWALLSALPELERYYLMENVERRMPREWPRLRRQVAEATAQVHEHGYCVSQGGWGAAMTTIAAPIVLERQAPLVISCIGPNAHASRTRIARELGPKLLTLVGEIQQARVGA
jgi:DNA-binding IclR family transcriptional regulator